MIPDILEIEEELYQNRVAAGLEEDKEDKQTRFKARVASVHKDIETLYKSGSGPCQISQILGVHPETVKARIAAIERDQNVSDIDVIMGPSEGGYFAILQP